MRLRAFELPPSDVLERTDHAARGRDRGAAALARPASQTSLDLAQDVRSTGTPAGAGGRGGSDAVGASADGLLPAHWLLT